MTNFVSLKQGEKFLIDGESYIVGEHLLDGGWRVTSASDPGKTQDLSPALQMKLVVERRLFIPLKNGAVPKHVHDACEKAVEAFSLLEQLEMRRAAGYVRAADQLGGKLDLSAKCLAPLIAAVAAENDDKSPPNWNTVRRWFNKYVGAGRDVRALIPGYGSRGNFSRKQPAWVHEVAETVIESFWLTKPGPKTTDAEKLFHAKVKEYATKHNYLIPPIGDTFFYRKTLEVDQYTRIFARVGAREAMLSLGPVGKGPQGSRPLDEVEVDATPLDIQVLHDHVDICMGRPWLVVIIDRRTRCILGFYLSFDPPSWLSTMHAMVHAIMPKNKEMAEFAGIQNPWPCHGVFEAIFTDRGKEFLSRSMSEAMFRLGARQVQLPARHPWLKGKVERWFRTLEGEVIHWIPGTTFSSPKEKGDYKSEKMAVLRLSELRWLITKWICDEYHPRVHRTTGRAPIQMWMNEVSTFGARPVPDARLLIPLVGLVIKRQLRRVGIEFQGLFYNFMDIARMRNRSAKDMDLDAHIKADPGDLSQVWVLDPVAGDWIVVPCTDPEYARGLTLAQHKVLQRAAAEIAGEGNRVSDGHLHEAKAQMIRAVGELMAARNKSGASRRLKSMMNALAKPGDFIEASKFDPGLSRSTLSEQMPATLSLADDRKPQSIYEDRARRQDEAVDQFDPTAYSAADLDSLSVPDELLDGEDDNVVAPTAPLHPTPPLREASPPREPAPTPAAQPPKPVRPSKLRDFGEI
jgi:putative transposase